MADPSPPLRFTLAELDLLVDGLHALRREAGPGWADSPSFHECRALRVRIQARIDYMEKAGLDGD